MYIYIYIFIYLFRDMSLILQLNMYIYDSFIVQSAGYVYTGTLSAAAVSSWRKACEQHA